MKTLSLLPTTTVKVLFKHLGENSDTAFSAVKVFNSETDAHLLNETGSRCFYHDDDRLVTINIYKVMEVEVPEGFDPARVDTLSWIATECHMNGLDPRCVSFDWLQKIRQFSDWQRVAMIDLLRVKSFRSEFRKSLRERLENWLDTENPAYKSPFSPKQWDCLAPRHPWEIKRQQESLYRAYRYIEFTGFNQWDYVQTKAPRYVQEKSA